MESLRYIFSAFRIWCISNKVLLGVAGILWLSTLVLGLVWPLPGTEGSESLQSFKQAGAQTNIDIEPEDLDAFLENTRWGVSLREIFEQGDSQEQRSVNPVLREMGYVGLISTLERNEVLLLMPEGGTQRLTIGDSLPDGRELVAIDENSLTLKDAQQNSEVLVLFPELPAELPEYPANNTDIIDGPLK